MSKISITPSVFIETGEIHEKFVRSGGPGGQNVNKVSSAVQLRFDVSKSAGLPARAKAKILASGDSRLTKDGVLVIFCDTYRTQEANRREVLNRLVEILREAATERKIRKPTKPTAGSVKRKRIEKTRRSETKKSRSKNFDID